MSLPPELRVLCHQLSSTPSIQLPSITPILLRNVLRCAGPLSASGGNAGKADASETAVLVHKFKTQISTLLFGKSSEGRFAAVVLIKGATDVGGWEILRGVEPWVKGLLTLLAKSDPVATKRICMMTLTSIYLKTHQYQSLVREISTPTLPTFVLSCLNLISPKSLGRPLETSLSLVEAIFESFCVLIPRHPTIFRPSIQQTRLVVRSYVAPTSREGLFVPISLRQIARRVFVLLHQTAAKNTSGEEWGKSARAVVKDIHATADQIFRAVTEDWESTAGYVSQPVDASLELCGGGKSEDDFPAWIGLDAGAERLIGLLGLLEEHFAPQTATAVIVPLGLIVDMLMRLMSNVPPVSSRRISEYSAVRLNPAVDRSERDGLWACLPAIHVAAMKIYVGLINRLQNSFTSMASGCLDQVTWSFPFGCHDEEYRALAYELTVKILRLCGPSLSKGSVDRMTPILRSCCREFEPTESRLGGPVSTMESGGKTAPYGAVGSSTTPNGVSNSHRSLYEASHRTEDLTSLDAAAELLPLLLSHLPQQLLKGDTRAEVDRTAILAHHKGAMLASVLSPHLGRNGRSLPSILPYLCRSACEEYSVEALLRPRMPLLYQAPIQDLGTDPVLEEEDIGDVVIGDIPLLEANPPTADNEQISVISHEHLPLANYWGEHAKGDGTRLVEQSHVVVDKAMVTKESFVLSEPTQGLNKGESTMAPSIQSEAIKASSIKSEEEEDSDSSVHLIMEMSESDEGSDLED